MALGLAAAARAEPALLETPAAALEEDAAQYARAYGVDLPEALGRLAAQEASVPQVAAVLAPYRARLAGLWIEHRPEWRIVVLLAGDAPVPDARIMAAGRAVTIAFRTGAPATRTQLLAALVARQAELRAALDHPPGLAPDPRSGTLLVFLQKEDIGSEGADALVARLAAIAGVPVTLRTWNEVAANAALVGGARVVGADPGGERRFVCTSGFAVTDGVRVGLTTAAHCPDALTLVDDDARVPLTMVDAWGARYQDVQIHVAADPLAPPPAALFHPDTAKARLRPLLSWRNRAGTRAGDFVCHRGERTGYSCAEVAYPDYAPPGDLCAGPCEPYWVAVLGPGCRSGDSGGPVFLGGVAFGTVKGASYTADGECRLFYYMSTDYLPPGWRLLRATAALRPPDPPPAAGPRPAPVPAPASVPAPVSVPAPDGSPATRPAGGAALRGAAAPG